MLSFFYRLHYRLMGEALTDVMRREEGQGLTEYALILVFVAIAAIVVLKVLGANIVSALSSAASAVTP